MIYELRQRRADGVYRWFQSRALPVRDTEGRITGWYMLLTDIDDRKRAEDALRSNEQRLRLIIDTYSRAHFHLESRQVRSNLSTAKPWNISARRLRNSRIGRPATRSIRMTFLA